MLLALGARAGCAGDEGWCRPARPSYPRARSRGAPRAPPPSRSATLEFPVRAAEGGRLVHLDVTQPEGWDAAVAAAVGSFGGLDVLVDAGIVNRGPVDQFTHEQWETIIGIDLTGVFNGVEAATEALKASDRASIVNVSSSAGMQGYEAIPGYVAAGGSGAPRPSPWTWGAAGRPSP